MGLGHPDVSVVIPVYNKQDVLKSTLESVLGQSFRTYEVVVVDDGSTDDGSSLVASFADPRIRLIQQTNQGSSAARNRGIREARGNWIALIDADDLWEPDHLAGLVSAVAEPALIGAFSNLIYASTGHAAIPFDVKSQIVEDYFSFALAANGYAISSSSVLVQRRQLVEAGLFTVGTAVGEDIDMWCRLAVRGPFRYVANASATYRDDLDSSTLARQLERHVPYPPGARTLHALISKGEVPDHLIASARRYANFLLLEYARQLLDCGDHLAARKVLRAREVLLACLWSDPKRYIKRLARTFAVGRWGYEMSRQFGFRATNMSLLQAAAAGALPGLV
jgi:glycosyltransferase involved in cell wall biosynthesis